ncbi:hypothetical protein HZH66_001270 [Vespula vulgaris]|uniref:Uncharacterized protein n=1 Tax=Vespula vulgaris TaxID=7454 RepID=A0A834KQS6_VESVU|nr:hypothetical protein HZH66_001270 [Vespula vulgaris]
MLDVPQARPFKKSHRQENKHFFPTTNNVPDKGKEHVCTYLHALNLYWVLDIQLITTRSLPDPLISYILFGDLQEMYNNYNNNYNNYNNNNNNINNNNNNNNNSNNNYYNNNN